MQKDQFYESLESQFKDNIKMAIIKHQQHENKYTDFTALYEELNHLFFFALNNGIHESDWEYLLYEVNPQAYELMYCNQAAAA